MFLRLRVSWDCHTNSQRLYLVARIERNSATESAGVTRTVLLLPLLLLLIFSIGIGGCVARAPGFRTGSRISAISTTVADQSYVQAVVSGYLFKLQSAKLALNRSRNPAVRAHAQSLYNDYSQLMSRTSTMLEAAGLTPPSLMLQPQHFRMFNDLQIADSAQFDETFQKLQLKTYLQSIELHQRYATSGSIAALRTLARQAFAMEQSHLAATQALRLDSPAIEGK